MPRYFKLVSLSDPADRTGVRSGSGKVRLEPTGDRSSPDLRQIKALPWEQWSPEQRVTWTCTKFLVERVSLCDRVVLQPEQPLERFLLGEVIAPGYEFAPGTLPDFNHLLHVRPLTLAPIPVNSNAVSAALKHDLCKRGHYYEVYPEPSIEELDRLVAAAQTSMLALGGIRSEEDTRDKTLKAIKQAIVREISRHWPVQDFERFCESLCNTLDYVEVKERKDRGKGWDLLVLLINPLTNTVLMEDIPVQCKNYTGAVDTTQPVDDLERCIRNSGSDTSLALLFIVGDLTDQFRKHVQLRQETLSVELGLPNKALHPTPPLAKNARAGAGEPQGRYADARSAATQCKMAARITYANETDGRF